MRRVVGIADFSEPGDYVLLDVCASCNVQGRCISAGGGVEFHYSHCAANIPKRGFALMCKCGKVLRSNLVHQVLSRDEDPLTIMPSWLCTVTGCHSFITEGIWRDC